VSIKLVITGGLALAFGATSYIAGNHYLDNQAQALVSEIENNRPVIEQIELAKVVVATGEFQFGELISNDMLKVVDWPQDAFPDGAFTSIQEASKDNNRRALGNIKPGEPILASKVTGEDGKAGLSSIISEGMRAVTIPVNTVNGVGGFVQPGDRVDLVLTDEGRDDGKTQSEIILEYVKVLSIDQQAGNLNQAAVIANSVTLETDINGAQKITRALSVGSLSLLLRSTGDNRTAQNEDGTDDGESIFSTEKPIPKTRLIKVTEGKETREVDVSIDAATVRQIKADKKNKRIN